MKSMRRFFPTPCLSDGSHPRDPQRYPSRSGIMMVIQSIRRMPRNVSSTKLCGRWPDCKKHDARPKRPLNSRKGLANRYAAGVFQTHMHSERSGPTAGSITSKSCCFLRFSIVYLDLQHREAPLQIRGSLTSPLFRREFGLYSSINDKCIAARWQGITISMHENNRSRKL